MGEGGGEGRKREEELSKKNPEYFFQFYLFFRFS